MLEDESGRIALGGCKLGVEVAHLVTGVVVAMKGTIDDRGVLDVSICSAHSLTHKYAKLSLACHHIPAESTIKQFA